MDIQPYKTLDQALIEAERVVKPLYYVSPINEDDEKKAFLAGWYKNPVFKYRALEYNPEEVEQRLSSIDIPVSDLGMIFNKKRRAVLLRNKIIAHLGDEDIVRDATDFLYGEPDEELVIYADFLLKQMFDYVGTRKKVKSKKVKKSLETALRENGLTDWTVEFSDKKLTTTYPAETKITVCKKRKFAKGAPERLAVHEVGVHALRAANGYEQPLQIFATGLQGYLPTEEGLSIYVEKLTGTIDEEQMRNNAARVIAVDSMVEGDTFRQTFDRLKSYDLTDNQAWGLAVRAYRGGGYSKDHVYLEGFRKVKEFVLNCGDLKDLYVGKIGIKDLPLVRELLKDGTLKPAKHIPKFLKR